MNNLNLHHVSKIQMVERTENLDAFTLPSRDYEVVDVRVTLTDGSEFEITMYGDDGKLINSNVEVV